MTRSPSATYPRRCIVRIHSALPKFGAPPSSAFDSIDVTRLLLAVGRAETASSADITGLLPGIGGAARASLRRSCMFAHRAVLLFPTTLDYAIRDFAKRGLGVATPIPSVLVRSRLCARYGLTHDECDVSVTRVRTASTRVQLEVFLFPKLSPVLEQGIINAERTFGFEDHIALEIPEPHEGTVERLMTILQQDVGLIFEGGGHNPHEGPGGSTVLYFVRDTAGSKRGPRFERFELYCRGDFSTVVDRHPVDQHAVDRLYADWAASDPRHLPIVTQPPTVKPTEQRSNRDHDANDGRATA